MSGAGGTGHFKNMRLIFFLLVIACAASSVEADLGEDSVIFNIVKKIAGDNPGISMDDVAYNNVHNTIDKNLPSYNSAERRNCVLEKSVDAGKDFYTAEMGVDENLLMDKAQPYIFKAEELCGIAPIVEEESKFSWFELFLLAVVLASIGLFGVLIVRHIITKRTPKHQQSDIELETVQSTRATEVTVIEQN